MPYDLELAADWTVDELTEYFTSGGETRPPVQILCLHSSAGCGAIFRKQLGPLGLDAPHLGFAFDFLDGHLEMDGRKIANHYIRGWFFLDVVATVPFDVILTLGVGYNGRAATSANVARLPRLARILRMSRLARLLRLPRLFRYTSAGKGQAGGDVQMMNSGYVQGALLLLLLYFYFYYY